MGKHNINSRRNYVKKRKKMLKDKRKQNESSTSQVEDEVKSSAESSSSSSPESPVEEFHCRGHTSGKCHDRCAMAQYRTTGDLPPEYQFNPMTDHLYASFVKFLQNKRRLQKLIENPLGH